MKEKEIEKYFCEIMTKVGAWQIKLQGLGFIGFPDRTVIQRGRVYFVELKRPNGKPRKSQQYVHRKIEQHGCRVFVLDTKEKVLNFAFEELVA